MDYNELGIEYWLAGQLPQAEHAFRKAIELNPQHASAYSNLGMILMEYGSFEQGFRKLLYAVKLDGNHAGAQMNLGIAYQRGNNLTAALKHYHNAFELDPDLPGLGPNYLAAMLEACDWEYISDFANNLLKNFSNNNSSWMEQVTPYNALLLPVPAEFHKQLAISEANKFIERIGVRKYIGARSNNSRIKIGYVSCDFRDNPVSHLTAGMYELHNRKEFEIYLYTFTPDDDSWYLKKIRTGADKFTHLFSHSAEQAAEKIKNDEIDILIDMTGYCGSSRPEIFAHRPAPIQINYLGYPASMGASFIDYFITDSVSIPDKYESFFTEKAIVLPHCYLPTDDQQLISDKFLKRSDQNLPEQGVVFCAFHRHFKLEPNIFASWMRILQGVPGSVLWLKRGSTESQARLQLHAKDLGIDPNRLIFNNKADIAEHLARHRLADLFLDTHYYNGHTTCCDALWAGLPVVTWPGEAFVSRGSSSLLHNLGLSELCANSLAQYEKIAIELVNNPERLKEIKEKLNTAIQTSPVFNTQLYVKNLERAYHAVWDIYMADQPPRDIKLS